MNQQKHQQQASGGDEIVPMLAPTSPTQTSLDSEMIYKQFCLLSKSVSRLRRAVIILGATAVFFFLAILITCLLLVIANRKNLRNLSDGGEESAYTHQSGCRNLDCIVTLGQLMQSINHSADPCQDFYAYSCGRFISRAKLEPTESSRSSWDINGHASDKLLQTILSKDRSFDEIRSSTEHKALAFFKSCLDKNLINKRGREVAISILTGVGTGDWYLLGSKARGVFNHTVFPVEKWRLEDSIVELAVRASFTVGVLGLVIHQDQYNVSRNLITIDAPNLTLGGRQLYLVNSSNAQLMTTYFNYIHRLASYFSPKNKTNEISNSSIWGIIEFERKIAQITPPAAVYEQVTENYKIMMIHELQKLCPIINWKRTFHRMLEKLGFNETEMPEIYEIAIFGDYLPKLAQLFSSHMATQDGALHIHNYMAFVGLHSHADDLGDDISDINSKFENVLGGVLPENLPSEDVEEEIIYEDYNLLETTTEEDAYYLEDVGDDDDYEVDQVSESVAIAEEREEICRLKTKQIFGLPLSKYFIDKYFGNNAKKVAVQLVEDIKNGFLAELEDPVVDWMDDVTKEQAKIKADRMVLNVGYPEILNNQTELDMKFQDLEITSDYVANTFNFYRYTVKQGFGDLKRIPDRGKWEMDPTESNAYYTTSSNKIVIPAAILQIPFFDPNWVPAINYGAIGSVIGHEITHGFDVAGSQFDYSGQISDWWDDSTRRHFNQRTNCMLDQYNSYTAHDGIKINGLMTLSENIADNGGLTAAYRAFKTKVGEESKQKSLPSTDLTNEQLFFVSFAQVWCQAIRPEQLVNDLETDTHSPNKFRVIGAVSNSKEFAEAYSCPLGSPMNPSKKCKVW